MSKRKLPQYPKRMVKHTSVYRGTLMEFQHYLNTLHSVLPFEAKNDGGSQLYHITSWYNKGILTKLLIERDKSFRGRPQHYLNLKESSDEKIS